MTQRTPTAGSLVGGRTGAVRYLVTGTVSQQHFAVVTLQHYSPGVTPGRGGDSASAAPTTGQLWPRRA